MKSASHVRVLFFGVLLTVVCGWIAPSLSCAESWQQENAPTAFQKGLAALQNHRIEEALAQFAEAERLHPQDAVVHNFRGIALVQAGKTAEAAAEYREAIRLDPKLEAAYRNLGFLDWTEHRWSGAHQALDRAVALAPDDQFAHYYLGRVHLDAQEYVEAIRELEISRVPLPKDANFSVQLSAAYVAVGRIEDARKLLDPLSVTAATQVQSVQPNPTTLAAQDKRVEANRVEINHAKMNNTETHAIQPSDAKPSASSGDSWRLFDLAMVYLLSASYDKAIAEAKRYNQRLSPADGKSAASADAWTVIGISADHLKQNDRAVSAFQQAATLAPGNEECWLNLTRELMDLNRFTEAIAAVKNALAANPASYALHLRLGAAYLAAGNYAEAEAAFRELVLAGDPLPTSYIGLAQVLMRTGRADEAVSELSVAEQKLGPNFLICYFMGLASDRAGKPLEALASFQEAVKLNPSNAEAHLSLGKTELGQGHVNDAISELQEALRLSPDNTQTKRLLSKAYSRAGDPKRAATYAQSSADAATNLENNNLVGDFFVPQWQMPPESARH